ncbi:hypothetical protein D3C85_1494400 [compost metagenome]
MSPRMVVGRVRNLPEASPSLLWSPRSQLTRFVPSAPPVVMMVWKSVGRLL